MAAGESDSYLEQCLAALPLEKRQAARRAFREISETGDDSYLSKLLAILEANGAYARQIPRDLTAAGDKLVREMAVVAKQLAEEESRRDKWYERVITAEFARLGKLLPGTQIAAGIERQNQVLDQLRRAADKPKSEEGQVGLAVCLLFIAFAIGVGSTVFYFWDDYRIAKQEKEFVDALLSAGIQVRVQPLETGTRLTLTGPSPGATTTLYDGNHTADGLVIEYGKAH